MVLADGTPDGAVTAVNGAAATIQSDLLSIAGTVLPYAAVLAALGIGWRFARKFVK